MPITEVTTVRKTTVTDQDKEATTILHTFNNLVSQLLNAVQEVFPEDIKTKEFQLKYEFAIKNNEENQKKLIQQWHNTMNPYYDRCREKDVTVIGEDIEIFTELELSQKFNDSEFDESSKDALWDYINHLNNYAQLYCQILGVYSTLSDVIPSSILGKIDSYAKNVADQMANGQMDLSQLDVQTLSQDVLGDVSEEDMQQMMNSLPVLAQNLSSIMPALQNSAGNEQLNSLLRNVDLSSLLQNFQPK